MSTMANWKVITKVIHRRMREKSITPLFIGLSQLFTQLCDRIEACATLPATNFGTKIGEEICRFMVNAKLDLMRLKKF